ncbi:dihydrolipoyl dehydrogenase [Massilibacterium senegalense]|uniref:dihydrolipoyl dehydrogenase n=1 Tax=Massilibacterium senegalense TaxID=1632858 RepID=UPI0007848E68|nr:dihydrolipoyl dehydrogenase [Massilibacterium senegalense]
MVVGEFTTEVDTLVIGAGPGGYVAAIRAAQLGQKVAIVDKGNVGGVCLNVGCIPSKALITASHKYVDATSGVAMGIQAENVTVDFSKVQQWKQNIVSQLTGGVEGLLKGNNVEILKGQALFVNEKEVRVLNGYEVNRYRFEHCIIATGSSPIELRDFPYSKRVIHSTGALMLEEIPKKMVVIGGGYIGIELGTTYANFGTEVTILEGGAQILPGFEKQMSQLVSRRLKKKGNVTIHTKALAKGVEETENGVYVTAEIKGEEQKIEADYVLVTVGRKPNTDELGLDMANIEVDDRGLIKVDRQCRTSNDRVFAIGDAVSGPSLAHKASYEGKIAAEAISGQKSEVDYVGIPAVVFSEPELATVGYTEAQAKEEGIDYTVAKFPFAANGRALTLNETDGFMKLITRKTDGVVIGAQVAGGHASDIISELSLAVECSVTAADIALTIHAHPTLGEMTMETAEVALGNPIHILTK